MASLIFFALTSILFGVSKGNAQSDILVYYDLAEHGGRAFATSNSADAIRAFRPDQYRNRQTRYWGASSSFRSGSDRQHRQVIWYRFDEPIGIAKINFDTCHQQWGCSYNDRKKRGPLEYKIIAARDCSDHFVEREWTTLHREHYDRYRWRSESFTAEHDLNPEEALRCYGIEILRVDSTRRGPVVADIQFRTVKCAPLIADPPANANGWNCNGALMGSVCPATCEGGRKPFGGAVCKRDGLFDTSGDIGCEFQCERPPIEAGSLKECERPRDGAKCRPVCDQLKFTDIQAIECHLEGNSTAKPPTTKWRVNSKPDSLLNNNLICAKVGVMSAECKTLQEGKCDLSKLDYLTQDAVKRYLGTSAKLNNTAVVVTTTDFDPLERGDLPKDCPEEEAIFHGKCGSKGCYVAARLPRNDSLYNIVLGDGKGYGGCINHALPNEYNVYLTVTALFRLDDGTIRKMVLLRESPQMSPTQIAVIVGVVVASILSCVGCCCCCANRDKILKRNSAPPAAVVVAAPADAGMPLMPTQQPPPPPATQPYYPTAGVAGYPQAPLPESQPQAPYPAAPPAYTQGPPYPNAPPTAAGMQPVAGGAPYPPAQMPPPGVAPYPPAQMPPPGVAPYPPAQMPPPAVAPLPYPPENQGPPPL